jgi:hypothetical protein
MLMPLSTQQGSVMTAHKPFPNREQNTNICLHGRFVGGRADVLTLLGDLWSAGVSLAEIASRLGRSLEAVRSRARRLRLAPRRRRRDLTAAGRERPCLSCTVPFVSEGAHNRLCETCRGRGDSDYRVAL